MLYRAMLVKSGSEISNNRPSFEQRVKEPHARTYVSNASYESKKEERNIREPSGGTSESVARASYVDDEPKVSTRTQI